MWRRLGSVSTTLSRRQHHYVCVVSVVRFAGFGVVIVRCVRYFKRSGGLRGSWSHRQFRGTRRGIFCSPQSGRNESERDALAPRVLDSILACLFLCARSEPWGLKRREGRAIWPRRHGDPWQCGNHLQQPRKVRGWSRIVYPTTIIYTVRRVANHLIIHQWM